MTDLELTQLCAEKMGVVVTAHPIRGKIYRCWFMDGNAQTEYDPLHNDAQAMAMVKKLKLCVAWIIDAWVVVDTDGARPAYTSRHLNRAICEWVAKL